MTLIGRKLTDRTDGSDIYRTAELWYLIGRRQNAQNVVAFLPELFRNVSPLILDSNFGNIAIIPDAVDATTGLPLENHYVELIGFFRISNELYPHCEPVPLKANETTQVKHCHAPLSTKCFELVPETADFEIDVEYKMVAPAFTKQFTLYAGDNGFGEMSEQTQKTTIKKAYSPLRIATFDNAVFEYPSTPGIPDSNCAIVDITLRPKAKSWSALLQTTHDVFCQDGSVGQRINTNSWNYDHTTQIYSYSIIEKAPCPDVTGAPPMASSLKKITAPRIRCLNAHFVSEAGIESRPELSTRG